MIEPACDSCKIASAEYACGGCYATRYCTLACQKTHWAACHRRDCDTLAALTSLSRLSERPRDDGSVRRLVGGKRDGADKTNGDGKDEWECERTAELEPREKKRRVLEAASPPPEPLTADGLERACAIMDLMSACPAVTTEVLRHMHDKDVSMLAATCSGFRRLLSTWGLEIDMHKLVLSDALSSFFRNEYPQRITSLSARVESAGALVNVLNITTLERLRLDVGRDAWTSSGAQRPIVSGAMLEAHSCENLRELEVSVDFHVAAAEFLAPIVLRARRLRKLACNNIVFSQTTAHGIRIASQELEDVRLVECSGEGIVEEVINIATLQRLRLKFFHLPEDLSPVIHRRPLRELAIHDDLTGWIKTGGPRPRFSGVLARFAPDLLELSLSGDSGASDAVLSATPLLSALGDDPPLRALRLETEHLKMRAILPDVFRRCKSLERLFLTRRYADARRFGIKPESFRADVQLPRLRCFHALHSGRDDVAPFAITRFPEKCGFVSALLGAAPALEYLHLPEMRLSPEDEAAVVASQRITRITCRLSKISAGEIFWNSAPRLVRAHLFVESVRCLLFPRYMPLLERLDLDFCMNSPVEASVPIVARSACPALREMAVTAAGFAWATSVFAYTGRVPSVLDRLSVGCTTSNGRNSAYKFAQSMSASGVRELRVVSLYWEPFPAAFALTADHAPRSAELQKLLVDSEITAEFMQALPTACPNLKTLKLYLRRETEAERYFAELDAAFATYETREGAPRIELRLSENLSEYVRRLRTRHPRVCFGVHYH